MQRLDTPIPPAAQDAMGTYIESARKLGRRTAELHLALAQPTPDPAFTPEPLAPEDLLRLADAMEAKALSALDGLQGNLDRLPASLVEPARAVLDGRELLLRRFGAIRTLDAKADRIRVHGDYHLGQVLWAEGDYFILGFDGDPARPLTDRRAKQLALKDVAGMLRSFAYVAYAGLFAYTKTRPELAERLDPWAQIWQGYSCDVFLGAYLATANRPSFLPTEPLALETLLNAFVLEKALYELEYELNNRPEWVRIPLWGILPFLAL